MKSELLQANWSLASRDKYTIQITRSHKNSEVSELLSCFQLCDPMDCNMPSFPFHPTPRACSNSLSVELMPFSHHVLCHPLLSSIFVSIRVFSNESVLPIRWPKCWSFSIKSVFLMNIQDWFPLGLTDFILQSKRLESLFQYHSSKASILRHSACFMVQHWTSIHDWLLGKP